jgi:MFS superfamily sulfate permease-like transporter
MRVSSVELGVVALIIGYIAFYTHPVPKHLQDLLSSPVGNVIVLGMILFVTVYHSLIVGVFLAIAFIMSVNTVTEYLDPNEQTPKMAEQPKSAGVSPPEVSGALKALLKGTKLSASKGDRLPLAAQKKGTSILHSTPPATAPKGSAPKAIETFASF